MHSIGRLLLGPLVHRVLTILLPSRADARVSLVATAGLWALAAVLALLIWLLPARLLLFSAGAAPALPNAVRLAKARVRLVNDHEYGHETRSHERGVCV